MRMKLFGYVGLRPKVKRAVYSFLQNVTRKEKKISHFYSQSVFNNDISSADSAEGKWYRHDTKEILKHGVSLKTIGSRAMGTSCLLVCISSRGYIFNCGEEILRNLESKYKNAMLKTQGIFVTSKCLKNVAGLKSFLLSCSENTKLPSQNYSIYGPSGLDHISSAFPIHPKLNVAYVPVKNEIINLEDNHSIQTVAIFSSSKAEQDASNYAVGYICKSSPFEGILTSESFIEAGIPPGPWINKLRYGQTVTLPDGRVIASHQLKRQRGFKGVTFIVIEIPSTSYLDSLLSCSDFHSIQRSSSGNSEDDIPEMIVHFTSPQVMKDPRYQQWANSFSSSVLHLVVNENSITKTKNIVIKNQLQLNHLLPNVFPLHHVPSVPFVRDNNNSNSVAMDSEILTDEYGFNTPTIQSCTSCYYLRPENKCISEVEEEIDPHEIIRTTFEEDHVKAALSRMRSNFEQLRMYLPRNSWPYPRVLFLGTVSPPATALRGNSAILVHTDPNSCFMLDCGGGTYGQMIQLMGNEKTETTLRQLKFVFISHNHFDHHGGLALVLEQRRRAFRNAGEKVPPIYILFSDDFVKRYVNNLQKLCGGTFLEHVLLVPNFALVKRKKYLALEHQLICQSLGLTKIELCFVRHLGNSFGIALSHSSGWKMTYSGDTMAPSDELMEIGMNSDLLIHEATFQDDLEEMAINKKHSTISQAIAAGKNMDASFTILTHFSGRYMGIPVLEQCPSNVGIAFDNMMVTFDDLPYLPHIYPVLQKIFKEVLEKNENYIYRRKNFPFLYTT